MKKTIIPLLTLATLVSCGGAGSGGSDSIPSGSHSPKVPSVSTENGGWTSNGDAIDNGSAPTTVVGNIQARKGQAIGIHGSTIIVAGGTLSGTATANTELIASNGTITDGSDLQEPVSEATVASSNTKGVTVVGGRRVDGTFSTKASQLLNNGAISDLPDLHTGNLGGKAVTLNEDFVIIGGKRNSPVSGGESFTSATINFDYPYWNSNNQDADENLPVYAYEGHELFGDGFYDVFVFGGKYSPKSVAMMNFTETNVYNVGQMSVARQGGHTVTKNSSMEAIIVGGGSLASDLCTKSVESISFPSINSISLGDLNIGRCGHTTTKLPDGDLLVVGGRKALASNSEVSNTIERYNVSTNTWTIVGKLTNARSGHSAFIVGSHVRVVGGTDASGNPVTSIEDVAY